MNAHTPGPWKHEDWQYRDSTNKIDRIVPVVISESAQIRVAVMDSDEGKENPYTVPLREAQANARLVAAAPAMIGTLKTTADVIEDLMQDGAFRRLESWSDREREAVALLWYITVHHRKTIAEIEGRL